MKKKVRKIGMGILLIVFVVSTALLLRQQLDNASGGDAYRDALALASGSGGKTETGTPTEETAPQTTWIPAPIEDDDPNLEELASIDLAALREVNEDVLGWICIPDSKINYPLLQGQDNDYYLKHTWDHRNNSVGSIFLEHRNRNDLTEFNTIVYGHNMNDGSMFAGLRRYSNAGYWEEHPYVYVATDAGVYRYEVFSAYKADVDSTTYGLSFNQQKTRAEFLVNALESSGIDTGIAPEMTDRILTLSTCSGAGYTTRWVVHARLRMIEVEA